MRRLQPDVVVVDRHPYGIAGELRPGLDVAARAWGGAGARPARRARRAGRGGPRAGRRRLARSGRAVRRRSGLRRPVLCDHELEYGLPVAPDLLRLGRRATPPAVIASRNSVVVSAGGGGRWRGRLPARCRAGCPPVPRLGGPGRRTVRDAGGSRRADHRPRVRGVGCRSSATLPAAPTCSRPPSAVVQMAGYNSTFEALAAGIRPVLVPRRTPRREQAIRAARLAGLGLADMVDEDAGVEEVLWLLRRDRLLPPGALASAGHGPGRSRARCGDDSRPGRRGRPTDRRRGRSPVTSTIRRVAAYGRPYRPALALGAALTLVEVALSLAQPWPMRWIVDRLLSPGTTRPPGGPPALPALGGRQPGRRSSSPASHRRLLGRPAAQRRRSAHRQRPAGRRARPAAAPVAALPRHPPGR